MGWVVGFNKKGKEEDAVIDVDGIETVTPAIIEACKQEPKASFWKKAEAELKKVFLILRRCLSLPPEAAGGSGALSPEPLFHEWIGDGHVTDCAPWP